MTSPAPRGRRPRRVDPAVAEGLRTLSAAPTDLVAGLAVTRIGRSPAEAETVVLLHGLGSARSAWAPLITALTERYHVLALDLPGTAAPRRYRTASRPIRGRWPTGCKRGCTPSACIGHT